MSTEGIVVKCQLMPLIVPQSICPSTRSQHPNQPSVNTQLTLFYFILTTFAVSAKRAHLIIIIIIIIIINLFSAISQWFNGAL